MSNRQTGTIASNVPDRQFIFVQGSGRQQLFSHFTDSDPIGGHYCLFQEGTEVSFRLAPDPNRKGASRAVDLQPVHPAEIPDRESSTIFKWQNGNGFAKRECGCIVHVAKADIATDLTHVRVGVGTQIWHATRPYVLQQLK